jgi:phosphoadenosine phosphosulfate reductase
MKDILGGFMFKVIWDKEINGVLLIDNVDENLTIVPPRPVFHEELNLFGFKKFYKWKYPETNEPLLWANDRRYYYKGDLVAEIKGGGLYSEPEIFVYPTGKELELTPINVDLMIQRNFKSLFVLENEALDFVTGLYEKYKGKVDNFLVAFSGGKDSQVVLDIVARVLPPDEYMVLFTDTDMEIPPTYETVEETKELYTKKYPGLRFEIAKSEKSAIEMWGIFGPPSRIHRWCCSVFKTSLFGRKVRDILALKKQPRLVVFEGVRSDESTQREKYNRIGEGVKHINLINSRIILNWNMIEVYLYIFFRNININNGYRMGLNRVGCSICPFASDWSEIIIGKRFPELTHKYVSVLEKMASNMGIISQSKINKYIDEGNWKKKSGGKGIEGDISRTDIITKEPDLEIIITHPKKDFYKWLKTMGEFITKVDNGIVNGELKFKDDTYQFEIKENKDNDKLFIKFFNTLKKFDFIYHIIRVFNKTTYCENCGVCEVECPTGALKVIPELEIDSKLCTKCCNCLKFVDRGCLIADRRRIPEGVTTLNLKTSRIDKYSTFGIRGEWLTAFFNEMDNWLTNNGLGPKQIPAMINWLRDAELMEKKDKKPSEFAYILKDIFFKNEILVWEIVWINLAFNAPIINWFVRNIEFDRGYSRSNELIEILKKEYENLSEGTLNNPLSALIDMLDKSPFGERLKLGLLEKKGKVTKTVTRCGRKEANELPIAYLLYKNAEIKGRYEWTVSDYYGNDEIGPYNIFGISRDVFENCLRSLQENPNSIVTVDLLSGLDNIHLREDLKPNDVLRILSKTPNLKK